MSVLRSQPELLSRRKREEKKLIEREVELKRKEREAFSEGAKERKTRKREIKV